MKWALIGASDVAAQQMIPAIRAGGDAISAVVSANVEHGRQFAAAHDIPHCTTELDAVLARDDIAAVYISSRNEYHASQALAALAAGKHVLCEKPIALSTADAEHILTAANKTSSVFGVNHHLPGAATHRAIRALIADGAIGEPLAVSIAHVGMLPKRLRGWRLDHGPGGGVVLDMTSHDASVINSALSVPAVLATAVGVTQGAWPADNVDAVMTSLVYGNTTVQTHNAYTIGYRSSRFDVFGTEGAILASDVMGPTPVGDVLLRTSSGTKQIDVGVRIGLYEAVVQAFVQAIAGAGEPTVTAAEGANAMVVALAINDSIAQGRTTRIDRWFTDGERVS